MDSRVEQVARILYEPSTSHPRLRNDVARAVIAHLDAEYAARVRGAVEVLRRAERGDRGTGEIKAKIGYALALLVASVQQTARAERLEGIIARAVAIVEGVVYVPERVPTWVEDVLAILKESDNG